MLQSDPSHFKRTLTRAVVLPLATMALLAGVLFWQLGALLSSSRLVEHSDQVLAQSNHLRRLLVDLETGLRGYLITGERDFLEPYTQAQPAILPAFENLADLVADDPAQAQRIQQVRPNYDRWVSYAQAVLKQRDAGGDYLALVRSRTGKQLMDSMRQQMIDFAAAEEQLRDTRSHDAQQAARIATASGVGLALLAVAGLALYTRRQISALSASYNRALSEQARLTRQIEEQSQRLSNVIANVPGLVWEAWGQPDAETQHIDFMSDYVTQMLGYSVEEWTSTPNFWLKIVHPEDQARAVQAAKETFDSGKPGANQFRWLRRDGQPIWVESFSVAISDEAGRPIGMRGVTIDITARKQAEQERARLSSYLRLLLDSTGEGIYGIDLNGLCMFINQSAAQQFGYSADELIGQNMHALSHSKRADGSAYPEAECPIRRALADGLRCNVEDEVFWRHDGSSFAVAYSAYPVIENSRITGAVVIFVDITGRKSNQQRQQFLMEATALLGTSLDYKQILERLAELVVPRIADWSAVHLLEENGAVHRLAVVHADPSKADLARQRADHYPLQPSAKHIVARVLATGTPEFYPSVPDDLLEAAARDAEHLKLLRELGFTSYICMPLIARGRTLGALTLVTASSGRHYEPADLAMAEDLAAHTAIAVDNARLYHEAQEAVKARDQFLSIASHELKTPLTSLIGYTDLMQRRSSRDGGLAERDQRAIRIISEQALRLNKLVTALLDLSRIETGQLSIEHSPVELNSLAQRVVEETLHTQPYETERIEFQSASGPLVLLGDEVRLEQVIQNLIQNALKYSPAGGMVTVWLERRDSMAYLHVRDQGIGIPAAALPNLFQRFYRAPNVADHHINGMGIGLFVVKEIVQLHGGTISVESQEGIGSVFTVCLPLQPDQPAPDGDIAVQDGALAEPA